jgi:hypothetical protein
MRMRSASLLLCAILKAGVAQDAAPTTEDLIHRAIAAQEAQFAKNWKFTFRQDAEHLPLDKNGNPGALSRKTFDVIRLEGDRYRKLILIDGQPPNAKLRKKIDADLEKARAERRKRSRLTAGAFKPDDVAQFERLYDNKVTGEEVISGRKTWRVESVGNSSDKPSNQEDQRFLSERRVTWFDQQDGFAIKYLEQFVRQDGALLPGSEIEREYGKHGEAWLPESYTMRYRTKEGRGEKRFHSYDFKKFDVESKIVDR